LKKIVLVGNTSWSMIKFRKGLIKKLIDLNYLVTIIAPYDKFKNDIEKLGCKYLDIDIDNKGSNPLKDIKLILKLRKIYKKINPDLVIHYTIKPNIYGTIASRLVGIKSIAVVTGLGFTFINNTLTSKIAKYLYKFSFKYPEKIIFINNDDKHEFILNNLVDKNNLINIPGEGIDTEFFKCEKINICITFRFLLIARMLWDKGVGEYVEAAKIIKRKYPEVEFGLLGYLDVDNPKAISKYQMEKWINDDYIKFYGSTDNVKEYISNVDCIVLPSYREGISMSLMESAAMSKPLIATNVPGCKELIDDGINGYLCKVKNIQDLVNKMEIMLNLSENERNIMGKVGRKKMINEFDEKIVINKYLETIKLLGENK